MLNLNQPGIARPYHAVATLIERHGLWRVLHAVLAASVNARPARRPQAPEGMSDHLRRDLGLAPQAPERRHWPPPF